MEGISGKQPLKNSLDSDEDDDEVNEDIYNVMNEDEFEGIQIWIAVIQINKYVIFIVIIFIVVSSYFVQYLIFLWDNLIICLTGTEDGPSAPEANVGFTAFNMKEELEEGHFDKDGHYLWKKEKQIRDNWLDNIDWVQVSEINKYNVKSAPKD